MVHKINICTKSSEKQYLECFVFLLTPPYDCRLYEGGPSLSPLLRDFLPFGTNGLESSSKLASSSDSVSCAKTFVMVLDFFRARAP